MTENTVSSEALVTVRDFASAPDLGMELEILEGWRGLDNEIRSPRIQKLGLALAGFTGYIHRDRVQVLGASEINYLHLLDPEERLVAVDRLRQCGLCCILITRGLDPPVEFMELCSAEQVPLLRSRALSSVSIAKTTEFLELRLAPRSTIHGVLLDVFGLGILLLGPSGIGKSECALELVLKGHRLVSDDAVELTRRGFDHLVGAGGPYLKHHIELRGLGIIDIKEIFGISATGGSQELNFAVRLAPWRPGAAYDRLGLEESTIEFLGVSIPIIEMPVAPGRNVATLVEVAARLHLLRQRGHQPARELLSHPSASEAKHS